MQPKAKPLQRPQPMNKASVLTALKELDFTDYPLQSPAEGEVRLKIAAVSICGSDVHYWHNGRIGSAVAKYPMVLGHEPSGIIESVGAGVKNLSPGMRVAIEPAMPCGLCRMCLIGKSHLCLKIRFLGTPPDDGILMQERNMPAHCCIPLPDNVSLIEGALMEPLGVGLHAARLAAPQIGESAAVFGLGAVGLLTMLSALLAGVDKVYAVDPVKERREMALKLGATAVFDPAGGNAAEWILDNTGGLGTDISFEASGEEEGFINSCLSAGRGGRAVIIGIPEKDYFAMPMHECRRKELAVLHCRRSNREADNAINLISTGRLPIKKLASHIYKFEDTGKALATAHNKSDGVIRAIVLPNNDIKVD